jgi:uncharacterized heparinase superfamily protein
MFGKAILLFNTVKYLKFIQIANRIKRKLIRPIVDLSSAPDISSANNQLKPIIKHQQKMFENQIFRFLNKEFNVKTLEDWNSNGQDKLWLYNLHYFDDLNAVNSEQRADRHCDLIQRWINENPPGFKYGWEPYPSSLRIVNWIKWSLLGADIKQDWHDSLATQVRYLSQNLEYHILGNHLFANAKALIYAGLYFQGTEAEKWYKTGIKIFNKELQEQVLPDGGNFELSPMYHAIFLEDLLDIFNIHQAFNKQFPYDITNKITSMFDWLRAMCHPDGEVSFFNDSVIGIVPNLTELEKYAERLKILLSKKIDEFTHLCDSGYIRVQKDNIVALLDVAHVGPSYIPGHAHADTLSFELSLFGQRMMVNSGTSCYEVGVERLRQRGTSAHNTVVINGENSSEVWGGFRVARRAKPFDLKINQSNKQIKISCSHDGYKRLRSGLVHTRKWTFDSDQLVIHDFVDRPFKEIVARYYFHPKVEVKLDASGKKGTASIDNKNIISFKVQQGVASILDTTYHPEFGLSISNKCLLIKLDSLESKVCFYW